VVRFENRCRSRTSSFKLQISGSTALVSSNICPNLLVPRVSGYCVEENLQYVTRAFSLLYSTSEYLRRLNTDPVTAYDPACGQRQSSHRLRWPYPAEFLTFEQRWILLKLVAVVVLVHVWRLPLTISRLVSGDRICVKPPSGSERRVAPPHKWETLPWAENMEALKETRKSWNL